MRDEVFNPFRFEQVVTQSPSDQLMLDRLAIRIDEFKDLAEIQDWKSIEKNLEICDRLQEAHNIIHDYHYPKEFLRQYRCRPCEMEGLCAIKHIVKNQEFRKNYLNQAAEYMGINIDAEAAKANIEKVYK